ncbi:MAG: hypothetical protein ABSB22_21225 [Thermodesulfobacteriota bacterium]
MSREEDIAYDFLENERIWPPNIAPNREHPFIKALVEVLMRLPNHIYEAVAEMVLFVVEDPRFMATNAPFNRVYPSCSNSHNVRFDTIVIFHQALACPHNALMGLLAHELAHSFSHLSDYKNDEILVDKLVAQWGFGKELEALEIERQKSMIETLSSNK